MSRIKEMFFDINVRLFEFLHYRSLLREFLQRAKDAENNAFNLIELLEKNDNIEMIVGERIDSFGWTVFLCERPIKDMKKWVVKCISFNRVPFAKEVKKAIERYDWTKGVKL